MTLDDPRDDTVLETLAFAAVGELLVLCHSIASPSDHDWDFWIEREKRKEHRALLISTHGGAPNSRQRARLAEASAKKVLRPPVALLTDSALIRSVMTAFAWVLGKRQPMSAFPPTGIDEALSWLGVTVRIERVQAVMARLHSGLAKTPIC
jgi:hypothetical protein